MKKVMSLLLLAILFALTLPASAANANLGGQKKYHNFISYLDWKRDSVNVASSDTLFLWADSASTVPFTTAAVGVMKSPLETSPARMPDSIGFMVKSFGDAADASTFNFGVQFSLNGKSGPWYAVGTADAITDAGATAQVDFPIARRLVPDAMFRVYITTTTATDVSRIAEVRAFPVNR